MTRKEFSSRYDALTKAGTRYGLGFMCLIFAFLFVMEPLSSYLKQHYGLHWSDKVADIVLLAMMIGAGISIVFWGKSLTRKYGLMCPLCGESLGDKASRWKVLKTGNCPKCRRAVFDEKAVAGTTAKYDLNREEFKTKFEGFSRRSNRRLLRLLIIYLLTICCGIPMMKYLRNFVDRGGLDWVTLTQWKWIAGFVLTDFSLFFLVIFILAAKGKFQPRGFPCPECGRSLFGRAGPVTVNTGMCVYCGCQLFEVPAVQAASGRTRSS